MEQGFFLAMHMCGRRLKRWNTGFLGSRAASQSEHDAETGEVGRLAVNMYDPYYDPMIWHIFRM